MNNKEKLYLVKIAEKDGTPGMPKGWSMKKLMSGLGTGMGAFAGGAGGASLGLTGGLLYGALKDPDEEEEESRLGNAFKWGLGGTLLGGGVGAGLGALLGSKSKVLSGLGSFADKKITAHENSQAQTAPAQKGSGPPPPAAPVDPNFYQDIPGE